MSPQQWPLVGRDEELEHVLGALVQDDVRGAVVVGEAGVGKSRLAAMACAQAAEQGMVVERVLGTHAAATIPLAAFADLLAPGAIGRPADRLGLYQATARALTRRAGNRPLLLHVDDAHLLDASSAALVLHLVVRGTARVIATVRSGESCPDAITALWKDGRTARLDLARLSDAHTQQLLECALGGSVSSRVIRWALRLSLGNPLFLRELILGALESGALARSHDLWELLREPALAPRLRELAEARVAGAADTERELLELVALAEPLEMQIAEQLVADDGAVERAENRGVLAATVTDGRLELRFAHPLYREAVADSIGAARTRSLCRRLVAAVESSGQQRPADLLRVARWRLDAGSAGDSAWLLAAAREAERVLDDSLAERLAAAAVSAGGELPAVLALAAARARCNHAVGSEELLDAWESRARLATQAPAYLSLRCSVLHSGVGRTDAAHALLDRAARWRADLAWSLQIAALRTRLFSEQRRMQAALNCGLPLIDAPGGGGEARRRAVSVVAYALAVVGRMAQADRLLEATFALSTRLQEGSDDVDVGALLAWTAVRLEGGTGWERLVEWLTGLHERTLTRHDDHAAAVLEGILGAAALSRGDLRLATQWLEQSTAGLELADIRGLLPHMLGLLGQALALAGKTERAGGVLARGEELLAARLNQVGCGELDRAAVWVAAAEGELSRAQRLALAAARDAREAPVLEAVFLHDALRLGAALSTAGRRLDQIATGTDSALTRARAEHGRAMREGNPDLLRAVAERFEEIGANLMAAEAYAQAEGHLRQRGFETAARASAARGEALAARCGGARTPLLAGGSGHLGLTPREQEIATLAARGLSNRLIAERLVLSTRTVESHLYNAMGKLSVRNRGELARLVA
ncbi:MAG: LuxR C-terminal-related transcriptional regulator [Solirubrobacteraceae bacterium]